MDFMKFFIKPKQQTTFQDKLFGSILGFVVGDALGVPVEFKERGSYPPLKQMIGYGTHHQPPGSWSDDSSLTLCLIDNLTDGYDLSKLEQAFCEWLYKGKWTHDGKLPFDVGQATNRAIARIQSGMKNAEKNSERNNGNGALMRILPLAFYLIDKPSEMKIEIIEEVASITHSHCRNLIACYFYVTFAMQLLRKEPSLDVYEAYIEAIKDTKDYVVFRGFHSEMIHFSRLFNENIQSVPLQEIKSSGYVIDTLEAIIWCLLNSKSYKEAVIHAVNLGDDTDTIAALTGGLSGIVYGTEEIPKKWIDKVVNREKILSLITNFHLSLSQSNFSPT